MCKSAILGIIFVLSGLALFFIPQLQPWGMQWFWIKSFVTVVTGLFPAFLVLIGLLLFWMYLGDRK